MKMKMKMKMKMEDEDEDDEDVNDGNEERHEEKKSFCSYGLAFSLRKGFGGGRS